VPRVISDDLYERLMGCVKQQRLLGVMGMLEEMQRDAVLVDETTSIYSSSYFGYDLNDYVVKERTWTENRNAKGTDKN